MCNSERREPSVQQLEIVDTFVFDLQVIGLTFKNFYLMLLIGYRMSCLYVLLYSCLCYANRTTLW